jgi:hypothetical protein
VSGYVGLLLLDELLNLHLNFGPGSPIVLLVEKFWHVSKPSGYALNERCFHRIMAL